MAAFHSGEGPVLSGRSPLGRIHKIGWPAAILIAALLPALFTGCGMDRTTGDRPPQHREIVVSAAVSLKDAFEEIGKAFTAKTGTAVTFNFGASGALQRQIEGGAPVDVFASAGEPQMDALASAKAIAEATRRDFARNSLVLIVPAESTLDISRLDDLAAPGIKRIAAGNPKTVPAGQYADEAITASGVGETLRPKLILGEDVRQVLEYVARGEADAGLVYATDAKIAGGKVRVAATVPASSHRPILYPIAVIKDSKNSDAARGFVEFVLSGDGWDILAKYGFSAAAN